MCAPGQAGLQESAAAPYNVVDYAVRDRGTGSIVCNYGCWSVSGWTSKIRMMPITVNMRKAAS